MSNSGAYFLSEDDIIVNFAKDTSDFLELSAVFSKHQKLIQSKKYPQTKSADL